MSLILKKSNTLFCGLIGFSGENNFDPAKIKSLFLYNASRGLEGCGMYNCGIITKSSEEVYSEIIKWNIVPEKLFIGHTRKSTYTQHKKEAHCHPFKAEHNGEIVIGAHNGTLTNHWQICSDYDVKSVDYDTDSQALFAMIAVDKNVLKRIKGAASIIYTVESESEEKPLFCFRKNDERPLWRGRCEEGLYISSIKESLEFIGCTNVEEFKTKCLYNIVDGKIINTRSMPDEQIIPKTVTVYNSNNTTLNNHLTNGYCDDYSRDNKDYNHIIARTGTYVKIITKDITAVQRERVKVGGYYKLSSNIRGSSIYAQLDISCEFDSTNGLDNMMTTMYNLDDVMICTPVKQEGVIAVAIRDGKHGTKTEDLVYVYDYKEGVNGDSDKLCYYTVYPKSKKKSTCWEWSVDAFRLITKHELEVLIKQLGDKTPKEIKKYAKSIGVGEASTKNKNTSVTVINPVIPKKEFKNIDVDEKANEAIISALAKVDVIKDVAEQVSIVKRMKIALENNESVIDAINKAFNVVNTTNTSTSVNDREEDDVSADIDADTPEDKSIDTSSNKKSKEKEYKPFDVYQAERSTISEMWIQLGDLYDDLEVLAEEVNTLSDEQSDCVNVNIDGMTEDAVQLFIDSETGGFLLSVEDHVKKVKDFVFKFEKIIKEEYLMQKGYLTRKKN